VGADHSRQDEFAAQVNDFVAGSGAQSRAAFNDAAIFDAQVAALDLRRRELNESCGFNEVSHWQKREMMNAE
jgi:hypothetical protein